jgi:hypothetical protein
MHCMSIGGSAPRWNYIDGFHQTQFSDEWEWELTMITYMTLHGACRMMFVAAAAQHGWGSNQPAGIWHLRVDVICDMLSEVHILNSITLDCLALYSAPSKSDMIYTALYSA